MSTCRIYPETPLPDPKKLETLRRLPSCVVSDQLERSGFVRGLRRMTSSSLGIMAGRALTVRTRPGDNLVIYQAVEIAEPGDILVVDGGGAMDRALMGEIFYNHVVARGIGGVVIDGCIRDAAEIGEGPVPVFARGAAHTAPFKDGPGELRGVVSVGQAVVRHGDLVVGDADGIAVVPVERLDETLRGGLELLELEKVKLAKAAAGETDTTWLADKLVVDWVDAPA